MKSVHSVGTKFDVDEGLDVKCTARHWAVSSLWIMPNGQSVSISLGWILKYIAYKQAKVLISSFFFFLWRVIYCQYDCRPVITHPDSFKHATINTFIMAMRTQWQGSVLVINLHRIISWICRSLRLKRGFIGSLSSLFGCLPSPVVFAHSHRALQRAFAENVR